MLILGLGSNVGNRLENLRAAIAVLKNQPFLKVGAIAPVYISDALLPDNAPDNWNHYYLNTALQCTTSLSPDELLTKLKAIELALCDGEKIHWGPRKMDIDILAWDNVSYQTSHLKIPHIGLIDRPFALWPLADLAPRFFITKYQKTVAELVEPWGSRFTGNAPFHTRQIPHRLDTPQIVGILNITPDSYSDGGLYFDPERALIQAEKLVEEGATVIDIGAESTSPVAKAIDENEEWRRLEMVLPTLMQKKKTFFIEPKVSVDTRYVCSARKSIELGADWINDVTGLSQPGMRALLAENKMDCVMMHNIKIPEDRSHHLPRQQNPTELVIDWAIKQINLLTQSGIDKNNIIFDPGIGFGKLADQSLEILQNIHVFQQLGLRLLVGHSRKTFMSLITNKTFKDRDIETNAISIHLANKNIDYIRVHNPNDTARTFRSHYAMKL